jgi:hypothetical protein
MLIGEEAPLSVDIRYFGFRTPGFPLPTFIDAVIVLLDADQKPLLTINLLNRHHKIRKGAPGFDVEDRGARQGRRQDGE